RGAARLLLDGRPCSPLGAAWAGAATLDSYDAHDGHALTKGHAGVVLLPALLSLCDAGKRMSRGEFMTCLVMGYEVATRAGIALHATSPNYHCSGAWNALGVTAMACRVLALSPRQIIEALGIADYHAPRGLMMRGVDHPTMVKDGAGAGALAGLQAALLAQSGFTGAPAEILAGDEAPWNDLGGRWHVLEQYLKPYPVCRWAQPAIEAAVAVQAEHFISAGDIEGIVVETFHEATRLDHPAPETTEQAQYSLPFPLAARLVHGDLGSGRISGEGLRDAQVLRLAQRIRLNQNPVFNGSFPQRRFAQVTMRVKDGREFTSPVCEPRGEPSHPLDKQELMEKFMKLSEPVLGHRRGALAADVVAMWDSAEPIDGLLSSLLSPAGQGR
ncbi:MAG: MmgE/PrpD family protein, partial [Ramlibacter sp.]|nr:MmgE/PrpD family protein [Ramlibacter sp.]